MTERSVLEALISAAATSAPARTALRAWALCLRATDKQESHRLLEVINGMPQVAR